MKLEDVFEQTHKLPTIPKVVQELIDSFSRDDIDIESIARKIALDQVITAKVLRLANSAHFGASRQIASVNEAVVVLGFNTVRTLVVASGVTGAFITTPGFDRKRFWKHSLRVATLAKWLAKPARYNGEIAFTTGMIHSIGEMLIHIVAPELAVKIDQYMENGAADRVALETNNIGFDYVMVGEELSRRWNFPVDIQMAVKYQNMPDKQEPASKLTHIVHLALVLAKNEENFEDIEELANSLPASSLQALGFDLAALMTQLPEIKDLASGMEEMIS